MENKLLSINLVLFLFVGNAAFLQHNFDYQTFYSYYIQHQIIYVDILASSFWLSLRKFQNLIVIAALENYCVRVTSSNCMHPIDPIVME